MYIYICNVDYRMHVRFISISRFMYDNVIFDFIIFYHGRLNKQ